MIPTEGLPIVTAATMRAAEEAVFAGGVPQSELMECAGAAVAREAARFAMGRPALVLAGPGNNGGDAWVAARLLRDGGHDVMVAALGEAKEGAAATMRAKWAGKVVDLADAPARPIVVDGLFGTGLTRPLAPDVVGQLQRLVAAAQFTLAIDLPSGMDTDHGRDLGAAGATVTLALGALKPSHLLGEGLGRCGHLLLADIGIPTATHWRTVAMPRLSEPGPRSHKYTRGLVVILEGHMPGAARLASNAALHGGAGYVVRVGEDDGQGPNAVVHRPITEFDKLLDDDRAGAVVIGPGLGHEEDMRGKLDAAIASARPLVLDGDALSLIGRDVGRLSGRAAPTCLTPHSGEFDRMFGEGRGSKIDRTLAAAAEAGAVIVHKGADTVIATPQGDIRVYAGGSPWLSTAGTGDVLAGLLGARLAGGVAPLAAAEAAVWLHGRAGQLAGPAFAADDLIPCLPRAIAECLR
ncbi:NAD(P)H-hydrate dehydratase [Sphingomonas asaccharolytica]|uniref:NAD(P)H-hydrate dehydratase n=1 Tax=Sphingomonas asaccharolytica TaxID=40681 RepID=UPI00082F5C2E|nr:NAD(P)H-hydrate dehydratase [Sphingomonas asaccharolytica]